MKIKEYFKKYPKDYIYDQYIRIILNFKSYYRITKNKMIDSIIEQYNRDGYLYNFCTNKELDLLSLLCEDNKDKIDISFLVNMIFKKLIVVHLIYAVTGCNDNIGFVAVS